MIRAMSPHFPIGMTMFLGAAIVGPTLAQAETLRVLDQQVMGEFRLQCEKIGEFSSLVALPDGARLIGISDRGYLAEIAVEITDDRLARVEVTAIHILTGANGTPVADADFSPEAAALLPDGALAIVDETTARVAVFDLTGAWLRDDLLPQSLRDVTLQASDKDGVEALAWTAETGLIAMTEEPQARAARNAHLIQTGLTGTWTLHVEGPESVSIKGMEVADGQLVLLERTRDDVTDALFPFVRIIDLADCAAAAACGGTTYPIPVAGITDADFEGIAALGDGRFLIVSDDRIDGTLRSVFVLFEVG
jgi:hypothetical protein